MFVFRGQTRTFTPATPHKPFLLNVVVLLGTFNRIKTLGSTSGMHVLADFFRHWFCVRVGSGARGRQHAKHVSLFLPISQTEVRETEGKEKRDRQEEGEL